MDYRLAPIAVYSVPLIVSVLFASIIWTLSAKGSGVLLVIPAINLLLLAVLYYYGTHNLLSALWIPRLAPSPNLASLGKIPKVAILVAVKNDINESVVRAMAKVRYPKDKLELCICDDSNEDSWKAEVDRIASGFGMRVIRRVIRRGESSGGKPGNVNNAVRQVDADYFAILDSDVEAPEEFLEGSLGYFSDPSVAFVQCKHRAKKSDESFSGLLGDGVNVFYERTMIRRSAYGITLALGHGLIVRKEAWEKVGGFPFRLADDFAFTLKVRIAGMKGIYNPYVECKEDFPPDYHALSVRSERWQRGGWELFPQALRIKGLRIQEKVDLVLETFRPNLSNAFVMFIATGILASLTGTLDLPVVLTPFVVFSLMTSLAPYLRTLGVRRGVISWGFATLVYNSMIFTTAKAVFVRQKEWRVTPKGKTAVGWLRSFSLAKTEFISGFLVLMGSILANAPLFLSVALPALSSVIMRKNPSLIRLKPQVVRSRVSVRGTVAGVFGLLMTFFIISLIMLPPLAVSGHGRGWLSPLWPAAPATLPTEM